jgi:hypothetical protein
MKKLALWRVPEDTASQHMEDDGDADDGDSNNDSNKY